MCDRLWYGCSYDDLSPELQISLKKVNGINPSLKDLRLLEANDLQKFPMFIRYTYDRERVPILYSVILIINFMCVIGIVTATFLNEPWEQTILSLAYGLLLWFASMNQGLINRWYALLDIITANAIFLLNLYFFALAMEWWHYLIGGLFILFFFIYNYYSAKLTVPLYEICTNIWHVGVILMIYLVPLSLKQKNLF